MYQGVDVGRTVPLDVLPVGQAADVLHIHYRCAHISVFNRPERLGGTQAAVACQDDHTAALASASGRQSQRCLYQGGCLTVCLAAQADRPRLQRQPGA